MSKIKCLKHPHAISPVLSCPVCCSSFVDECKDEARVELEAVNFDHYTQQKARLEKERTASNKNVLKSKDHKR